MKDLIYIASFADDKKKYHHARAKISTGEIKEFHIIAASDFAEIELTLKKETNHCWVKS